MLFSTWKPRWDSQQPSFWVGCCGARQSGLSTRVALPVQLSARTHAPLSRTLPALGWSDCDFSFPDVCTMDGSGSLQASFQQ